jgi:transcriptional regulator with XRE-family HTH domain
MTSIRPSQLFPEFQVVPGLDEARARDFPFSELALAIARLRGEHGLTQTEFAQRIGTTQSAVARVESGRHGVQVNLLNRIAQAFGTRWNLTFGETNAGRSVDKRDAASPSGDALVDAFNAANTNHDFDQARRVANKVRRDPSTPRRRLVLALEAFNRAHFPLASRWSQAALEGSLPKASHDVASIVLGRSLLALGQANEALKALEAAGTSWIANAARAEALMAAERHAEAIALADRLFADADAEQLPAAAFLAARVYWHADQPLRALERIGAFRAVQPDDREGILLHGAILGHLGDLQADHSCHEAALALFEAAGHDDPETMRLLAMTAARLGRWRHALDTAKRMKDASAEGAGYERSASGIARECFPYLKESAEILAAADHAEALGLLDKTELRSHRALGHALTGDFATAVFALGLTTETLTTASPDDQIRCAIAYLVNDDLKDAFPILRDNASALSNPEGELQLARSALAAGNTTTARAALGRVAKSKGEAARTAGVALDLVKAIEAAGAQKILASLTSTAPRPSPGVLVLIEPGTAPDSIWEGPEGTFGRPTHVAASPVLNRLAQESLSVGVIH